VLYDRPSSIRIRKFDFLRVGKARTIRAGDEKRQTRPAANGRSSTPQLHHQLRPAASGAHACLRLVLELDGEVVARVDPAYRLLHRGTEKADRAQDLLAGDNVFRRPRLRRADESGTRVLLAAEKLLGIAVPRRAN